MTKLIPSEHDEQVALFQRINKVLLPKFPEVNWTHAIPNQGGAGVKGMLRTVQMKEEGQKSGVSDICHPVPRWHHLDLNIRFTGLYIELKRPPSVSPKRGSISYHKPSKEQQWFGDFATGHGWFFGCANGQDEAFDMLSWYLNLQIIHPSLLFNNYDYWDDHERG